MHVDNLRLEQSEGAREAQVLDESKGLSAKVRREAEDVVEVRRDLAFRSGGEGGVACWRAEGVVEGDRGGGREAEEVEEGEEEEEGEEVLRAVLQRAWSQRDVQISELDDRGAAVTAESSRGTPARRYFQSSPLLTLAVQAVPAAASTGLQLTADSLGVAPQHRRSPLRSGVEFSQQPFLPLTRTLLTLYPDPLRELLPPCVGRLDRGLSIWGAMAEEAWGSKSGGAIPSRKGLSPSCGDGLEEAREGVRGSRWRDVEEEERGLLRVWTFAFRTAWAMRAVLRDISLRSHSTVQ